MGQWLSALSVTVIGGIIVALVVPHLTGMNNNSPIPSKWASPLEHLRELYPGR